MVIGYHVVIGAYGFWLPNDPRGSWSDFVGSWELYRFGPATRTNTTRSQANAPHDQKLRQRSKEGLKRPPVSFSGVQALAIGRGFGRYVDQSVLPVWACAILPEHIHLVVGRSQLSIEQVVTTPLGESWAATLPDLLVLAERNVRHYIHPTAWDPVALFILGLPGFAVFGILALLFYAIGRKPKRRAGSFAIEV